MPKHNHTFIPEFRCLKCNYRMDCTTEAFGEGMPKAGDLSMCMMCGYLMVFNEDLTVRELTPEERVRVKSDPNVIRADIVRAGVVANKPKR